MPNYEYNCLTCGKTLEIHHKMSEAAPLLAPGCITDNCHLEKKMSAPASVVRSGNPLSGHRLNGSSGASLPSQSNAESGAVHSCGTGCTFHRH